MALPPTRCVNLKAGRYKMPGKFALQDCFFGQRRERHCPGMDTFKNQEFLEQALIQALRCRLEAALTAMEAAFHPCQYAQAAAALQTAESKAPTP